MFIRFDRVHERDGQTDGRTPHDGIGHADAQHRHADAQHRTAKSPAEQSNVSSAGSLQRLHVQNDRWLSVLLISPRFAVTQQRAAVDRLPTSS